jgi:hypothetical protein|eukprot:COSAG06_NODE_147_length_22091_cov_70.669880_23_plen_41_part_00
MVHESHSLFNLASEFSYVTILILCVVPSPWMTGTVLHNRI